MEKNFKKNKNITLDDLARMIKRGFNETAKKADVDARFEHIDKRFEQVDKRFERLENVVADGFRNIHARLELIERDIQTFVTREEFDDLMARMKYVEKKIGILSGK
jgi:tetrahydromethanopterin S-methyltransferase subunit G